MARTLGGRAGGGSDGDGGDGDSGDGDGDGGGQTFLAHPGPIPKACRDQISHKGNPSLRYRAPHPGDRSDGNFPGISKHIGIYIYIEIERERES